MLHISNAYCGRLRRVLDYIEAHPDGELTIERLSGIAAFSKYHFHRQFSELFGLGVHQYVQLVRLKRSAYQLAFRRNRIIDVALECGYESHEAFTRAFKKHTGQTPSEFRQQPNWSPWQATYQPLKELRTQYMKPNYQPQDVKIVDFAATRVACLSHRGDPRLLGDSIRNFIAWRKENHLPPRLSATFNIAHTGPAHTPPEAFHFDLCAAITQPVAANSFGVVEGLIPAGRCAVLRHIGSDDHLGQAIAYLYSDWLPASDEEPRDFPLFFQRVAFFPDVPESEAVTDIFLPLR